MRLKAVYENEADIPAEYKALFVQRGDVWEIQVDGMKTQGDVDRLQSSLTKERNDHKETKEKLRPYTDTFGERTADEIQTELDRIPELEATGGNGEIDETKIEKIVETRVNAKVTPLQRELDKVTRERDEAVTERDGLSTEKRKRTVGDAIREGAKSIKVQDGAVDDILMYEGHFEINEAGEVVTNEASGRPGLSAEAWLQDMQDKRPHWWGPSKGGNAQGSGTGGALAGNPWTKEGWNMTAQGQLVATNRAKAEQLAAAAGSKIGAVQPPA